MGQIEDFLEKSENQELRGHFSFTEYVHVNYNPQPDITAYELSQILGIVLRLNAGYGMTRLEYNNLSEGIRRHILLAEESK
jgi:hypothetical protein